MRTTCSETPASAPRDKLAPGATTVMPARVLALGQEKHLRVEQVPRGRAVRLCPGRGGFSILTLATCSSLLKVKLGSSSQGPKRKTVWQNWHESLPGRVISRCLYPCTTVGTHTGVQLRNEPQEPPGQGARGRRREPGTPHPRGPSEALSRQPTRSLSSAARGAVRGLPLRGDGREHRPPPCSAARCTSCRPSAPEASPSAAPTARRQTDGLPSGGRARHAPHPGIPCARSPRLGSAAALRLHSRHGCLQQISHRAPFRHCRRHGRRLRAALPAQQAAGRGPARVSRTGRGAKGRGRAAVVRGAGRDGVGPRGRARGSPCRGARCLRPSGPRPGEEAASAAPAPLLELYSLS